MMNVAITGSTGFIGTNLRIYLEQNNVTVTPLSVRYNQTPEKITADAIVHLAGKAHDLKNTSDDQAYIESNNLLTRQLFDSFLASDAAIFIFVSSVKAVADEVPGELTEDVVPDPKTIYGKSKLLAEQYILSKGLPVGKRVYILRPCMVHGPNNKGNLNLLFGIVKAGIPYPLGAFDNRRSVLSVENFCFAVNEILHRDDIATGVYNISDNAPVSTNRIMSIAGKVLKKDIRILKISKKLIRFVASVGDVLPFPLNSERLKKLTENYIVSNQKLIIALKKPLPVETDEGLERTFRSFVKE